MHGARKRVADVDINARSSKNHCADGDTSDALPGTETKSVVMAVTPPGAAVAVQATPQVNMSSKDVMYYLKLIIDFEKSFPEEIIRNNINDLIKHIKDDYTEAQFLLGKFYGMGVVKDEKIAVEWYTKAAVQGHAKAQYMLGLSCEYGRGTPKDEKAAVEWIAKSAAQGSDDAQYRLGWYYEQGLGGITPNIKTAVEWYKKAAAQENADAQYMLGYCYENNRGVDTDLNVAVDWYKKAATQGETYAEYALAMCYKMGRGVAKDQEAFIHWCTKAATKGFANAQYMLGNYYEEYYQEGDVVGERDLIKAKEWYHKAAAQGHAMAELNLQLLYMHNHLKVGLFASPEKSSEHGRRAAARGNRAAQQHLDREKARQGNGMF